MSFQNASIKCVNGNAEEYHKDDFERGHPRFRMSSGALRQFGYCPSRWKAGYESPSTPSTDFGCLLDMLLLTPDSFRARYAVQPETYVNEDGEEKKWNNNAKVCRKWVEEQEGRAIVHNDDVEEARKAVHRIMADDDAYTFLAHSETQVWVEGEWVDKSGLVVPVKGLIDIVPSKSEIYHTCLGDLKSTRCAALLPWQRFCFTQGYHIQAAWYLDLYRAATGEDRNTFCFLLAENFPPYEPAKRMLSQDALAFGRAEVDRLMANYCACLKHNQWPGYDDTDEAVEGWGLVQADPWLQERAMFAPRYDFATDEVGAELAQPDDEDVPH